MRRPADEVVHVHSGAGAGAEPAHGDVRGAGMVSSRRTMRPSARENAWPATDAFRRRGVRISLVGLPLAAVCLARFTTPCSGDLSSPGTVVAADVEGLAGMVAGFGEVDEQGGCVGSGQAGGPVQQAG